jgi:hypothetical protein
LFQRKPRSLPCPDKQSWLYQSWNSTRHKET